MIRHRPLLLILLGYLLTGVFYAAYTPAWQAPDEPAHYNVIAQLANGRFPVMTAGDYDEAYKNAAVSSGFAPEYDVSRITYEDWQPPLYYLLLTPIFWLSGGALLALRWASLLLGAGVVALAYAIGRHLWPDVVWPAATTAVFVAFIPQHMAIMAAVNNDALAELMIAALLLAALRYWQQPSARLALGLGVLQGLGYLTKGTVYPLTAVVALVILVRHWRDWPTFWGRGLRAGLVALAIGAPWWLRNAIVYGNFDVLGKAAHDAIVVGQPRTSEWIAQFGLGGTIEQFLTTTFRSFWGQFGWMALPMLNPWWLYPLLGLLSAAAAVGLLWAAWQNRNVLRRRTAVPVWLLALAALLTLGVHVGYNLTFVQHQGRYLFPALIPIGLGLTVGLASWLQPWHGRFPWLLKLLPLGLGLFLFALDWYALFRIIIPNL